MRRHDALAAHRLHELERSRDAHGGVREPEHRSVTEELDQPASVTGRRRVRLALERRGGEDRGLVAALPRERREAGQVHEHDRGRPERGGRWREPAGREEPLESLDDPVHASVLEVAGAQPREHLRDQVRHPHERRRGRRPGTPRARRGTAALAPAPRSARPRDPPTRASPRALPAPATAPRGSARPRRGPAATPGGSARAEPPRRRGSARPGRASGSPITSNTDGRISAPGPALAWNSANVRVDSGPGWYGRYSSVRWNDRNPSATARSSVSAGSPLSRSADTIFEASTSPNENRPSLVRRQQADVAEPPDPILRAAGLAGDLGGRVVPGHTGILVSRSGRPRITR